MEVESWFFPIEGEYVDKFTNYPDSKYTFEKLGNANKLNEYLSNTDFVIDADNRRIAQAVIKFVPPVDVNEISLEEMEKRVTERGDGGFGHTGRN